MTLESKNSYNQVIELEILDDLIFSSTTKMIISILLFFLKKINEEHELKKKFLFDVVKYGFQGYYPAIGVKYLSNIDYHEVSFVLEEDLNKKFLKFAEQINMLDFIEFMVDNETEISEILKKFDAEPPLG